jgi:hypothetical protein
MKQSVTKLLYTVAQNVNPITLHFFTSYFVLRSQRTVTTPDKLSAFFGSTHICVQFSEKRTEIDPTMKDDRAVFALQLLKHIPVSTFA